MHGRGPSPSPQNCGLEGAEYPLVKPVQGRKECFVRRRLRDMVVSGMSGNYSE